MSRAVASPSPFSANTLRAAVSNFARLFALRSSRRPARAGESSRSLPTSCVVPDSGPWETATADRQLGNERSLERDLAGHLRDGGLVVGHRPARGELELRAPRHERQGIRGKLRGQRLRLAACRGSVELERDLLLLGLATQLALERRLELQLEAARISRRLLAARGEPDLAVRVVELADEELEL